jgi:hypothetical protein
VEYCLQWNWEEEGSAEEKSVAFFRLPSLSSPFTQSQNYLNHSDQIWIFQKSSLQLITPLPTTSIKYLKPLNLLKALAAVSSMTFISRILGFARHHHRADFWRRVWQPMLFLSRFRIPNLLRRIFAEGAFSQAFVPILAEYKNTRTPEETHDLIDHITMLLRHHAVPCDCPWYYRGTAHYLRQRARDSPPIRTNSI